MTSIEMENLCPVKIAEEYKKNPLLKPEDVATLREWVLSVPSYPKNIPDILYAIFLGSSNFNVEEAKVYIDNSIKVRTEAPELFSNRDPQNPNIKATWELIDAWVTPKATPDNYRILYSGFVNPDPTTYSFSEACKVFVMVGEAYVLQNGTTPGIIVVLDAKGGSYRHLLKAKMHTINKFLFYVQEAIPCHIAQVHVININPVIDKIMFLIKPFIKKALMENIYFHTSDLTEFYKRVSKDVLPSDLGGNSNTTRKELQQETLANFDSLRNWFIQEASFRLNYDDKIKNQRKQSNSKLEETETSFKSLSID